MVGRVRVPPVIFQTPIPTAGSEMTIAIAILIWILLVVLISRRFRRIWGYFGDIISFLVYFLGIVLLEILMF